MSLDIYLNRDITESYEKWKSEKESAMKEAEKAPSLIPAVEEYYAQRCPDNDEDLTVFDCNITHNLGAMAGEAGIYQHLWRPEELGITKAGELIEPLKTGLSLLKSDPKRFQAFNASNGWGMYEHFVPFVEKYLNACIEYPNSIITVS